MTISVWPKGVREMEEAVDKRLLKILEQLDAEDNRMIPNDKKRKNLYKGLLATVLLKKELRKSKECKETPI